MPHRFDLDIQPPQIARLSSPDAIAAFLLDLGYPTGNRKALAPSGFNLGDSEAQVSHLELLSQDPEGLLRVVFARLKSVTAKTRGDLVRAFGKDPVADHLLILTSDFDSLEFVLIEKESRGPSRAIGKSVAPKVHERVFVVPRKWPQAMLRIVRRLTWTTADGGLQYDKLLKVFEAAHYTETYFLNRALFADHFLLTRLREGDAWRSAPPGPALQSVNGLMAAAAAAIESRATDATLAATKQDLYDPIWKVLGYKATAVLRADDAVTPDYRLSAPDGTARTVALTYPWRRWLDGPDSHDSERPAENPGAAVVTLLERGDADWVIVTNGKQWRLYSRAAHSRSTNFYEVDLQDALMVSGLTDPNEAFRYWWLFFRLEAFLPTATDPKKVWLDTVADGSREYAREVEAELKRRVFYDVVPMLASGFLHDRRTRLKKSAQPTEIELEDIRAGTLTLLYRILFMLYAEARDLLPVREDAYYRISLKRLKEEIREAGGIAQTEADAKLEAEFSKMKADLYDRLASPVENKRDRLKESLFRAMAFGQPAANVPKYNGGLFRLDPAEASDEREAHICRFLNEHKVPDYHLAAAIDRLARVEDQKTFSLAFVDYKSLGVRQLGSIYEGLLEFRLHLAEEDLAIKDGKGLGDYIPLAKARGGKGTARKKLREVKKGEPILQRDNTERKATGSYYTPDHIVEYIVHNTVGPVLTRKLDALRDDFRKAEATFHRELGNIRSHPQPLLGHEAAAGLRARRAADPLAKPIEADFRKYALLRTHDQHKDLVERLFDLKVLDPAMGSGHFLVEAVDFITDELLHFLNGFPVNPVMAALERTREAILGSLREQGLQTDQALERQLTDVHLLKRHVLKRCIYGVDLNPLATELAKVSLWLDAFTIGAPLSFLDHHLRTGNSLIGSSLKELEDAVRGQLWRIDESHLLRAVQSVLQVASLTDATAGEVAESKRSFDEARRSLASYGIILDILVAKHFGLERAGATIAEMSPRLDFSSRENLLLSFEREVKGTTLPETEIEAFLKARGVTLKSRMKADILGSVGALAAQERFFHWDLEFPEVFYRLVGLGGGRIERRPKAESGFDAVVGNPPYVRMELIKRIKPWLASAFRCHAERADLFVYFIERELSLSLLDSRGRFGAICSSNWTKTDSGTALRTLLSTEASLERYVDLTDAGVFPEVDTYPCVLIAEHARPSAGHVVRAFRPAIGHLDDLEGEQTVWNVLQESLNGAPWHFGDSDRAALHQKLRGLGQSLNQVVGSPLYGIKTGLNEAFVISEDQHARMVEEDPRSHEVLIPFIEGDDVTAWRTAPRGKWLIYTPKGTNIKRYPAIERHLRPFRDRLAARATQQEWWELQQAQAKYADAFKSPKIVYPRFVNRPLFALETSGAFVNNAISILPTDDPCLLFSLMSPATWFVLRETGAPMAGGYRQIHGHVLEAIRIPDFTPAHRKAITEWFEVGTTRGSFENPPWDIVFSAFDLTRREIDLILMEVVA